MNIKMDMTTWLWFVELHEFGLLLFQTNCNGE